MHNESSAFRGLPSGSDLTPLRVIVSPSANERYWSAAGVDHPALRAGALYPPIAANLTILMFQQTCAEPMIQTRQRLVCRWWSRGRSPTGTRSVDASMSTCAHSSHRKPSRCASAGNRRCRSLRPARYRHDRPPLAHAHCRHAPGLLTARQLPLRSRPSPAAGWGEEFITHGEIDLRFVGMVWDGQTVEATADVTGNDAVLSVTNVSTGRVAVAGSARRLASIS
jgi:hypothetical protein